VLDVATGTGDVALEIARITPASLKITGADFSPEMVALGQAKIAALPMPTGLISRLPPVKICPLVLDTFDSVTIAFGIRNVVDRRLGLAELWRVIKPGGRLVILEFSTPRSALFRWLISFLLSNNSAGYRRDFFQV
jgi:demethylmenaquinone methyltransferase / 2-methoxy-6-polyprenyl-1,4-benzoquinol methylase